MKVRGKPVAGSQYWEEGSGVRIAERVCPNLLLKESFCTDQLTFITMPVDTARPIMSQKDVQLSTDLRNPPNLILTNMVCTSHAAIVIRGMFPVTLRIIPTLEYPGQTAYSDSLHSYNTPISQKVDIWCHPTPMIKLP